MYHRLSRLLINLNESGYRYHTPSFVFTIAMPMLTALNTTSINSNNEPTDAKNSIAPRK